MSDTYSYSVRVVQHNPAMTARHRRAALEADRQVMRDMMGWELVYSTHSLDHTTTLYRRPAPINSVDTYTSQVVNSPDPT